MATDKPKHVPLEISVELEGLEEELGWPNIAAYVFDRGNCLLAKQSLKQDAKRPTTGRAKLEVEAAEEEEELVVKIGPDVDDFGSLRRYQPAVKRALATLEEEVTLSFDLLKPIWLCWLKVPYVVTGTVEMDSNTPICAGEVDIYDVDVGYCFLRLPESIIERLRDSIIDVVVDPPPFELPELPRRLHGDDDDWCGTGPKPPFPPVRMDIAEKLEALPPEWAFAKDRHQALPTARARMSAEMEEMPLAEKRAWLDTNAIEGVKVSQLLYSNTAQFRGLLIEHFQAFRFWLCWYPWIYWLWWPYCWWYSLEKLGTAKLQSDGSFSKTVWLSICRHDTPDLWFVVRQEINGVERVIYARHPVPCNTYWNHPSGKPVHLVVTDPNAVACQSPTPVDKPGVHVMPLGIGWDGWDEIQQAHIKPPAVADPKRGLHSGTDPYGTRLDLTMQFHKGLRRPGVKGTWYYRWSYRKEGTTAWTHIGTPITHRYLTMLGGKYVILAYPLGPKSVPGGESDLFEIPDPSKAWVNSSRNDRAFAIWHTDGLLNGKYELRLEMFNKQGQKVTPTISQFKYFLPIGPAAGGIWPVDNALHVEPDGSIILHVHVDNSDTVAEIQSVAFGGVPAKECQFIEYQNKLTDDVDVKYVAYHPNGFLHHYDLTVKRGVSGTVVASLHPTTPASVPTTKSFKVKDLLGPYSKCAFAVELHTWPRTRDGYGRVRAYEDHDTSAFALVEKAKTTS